MLGPPVDWPGTPMGSADGPPPREAPGPGPAGCCRPWPAARGPAPTPPGSRSTTAICSSRSRLCRAQAEPDQELLADAHAIRRVALGVEELADDLDPLGELRGRRIAIEPGLVDHGIRRQRCARAREGERARRFRDRHASASRRPAASAPAGCRPGRSRRCPASRRPAPPWRRRRAPAACRPPTATTRGPRSPRRRSSRAPRAACGRAGPGSGAPAGRAAARRGRARRSRPPRRSPSSASTRARPRRCDPHRRSAASAGRSTRGRPPRGRSSTSRRGGSSAPARRWRSPRSA